MKFTTSNITINKIHFIVVISTLCVGLLFGQVAFVAAFSDLPAPITIAHQKIKAAGIPIHGLSGWPVQRIDFKDEATESQKQQAWDIVNSFDEVKELKKARKASGLVTSYNTEVPELTQDGQISIAQVNGTPYIYFQADGKIQHILGGSSFEISPEERTDRISGEPMEIGDFVIGMIDKNLENGATSEESSLHGIWVKWSSVKKQLIEELKASGALNSEGQITAGGDSGLSWLASLGISIKNGATHILNLAVDKFFAKTARIERLEVIDKATGQVYCTWLENGEWQKELGECDALFGQSQTNQDTALPQNENLPDNLLETEPAPAPALENEPAPASEPEPEAPPEPVIEQAPVIYESPIEIELPAKEPSPAPETPSPAEELTEESSQLPADNSE